ncbi:MAG: Gfo/Idh/MocA family protein [Verrucomicrobiales bacterium]
MRTHSLVLTEPSSVRLGVIGLGNMGRYHSSILKSGKIPGATLAAGCDLVPETASHLGGVPYFEDYHKLYASGLVDAVVVATPHYDHTPAGIAALQAGLHVMMEKPLTVEKAEAERLIFAHQDKHLVFGAMLNQRTNPLYIKVRELVHSGELGRINRVHWTITDWFRTQAYYRSSSWRATWIGEGGGVLINQAVHNLDLLQWIFGMPASVFGRCQFGRHHAIEVEDEAIAILQYADGKTATFVTSTGEAPGLNRLEIAGDRGLLIVEGGALTFLRNEHPTSNAIQHFVEGYSRPQAWRAEIPVPGQPGSQHAGILQNFVRAINQEDDLIAPASEGIHSVELLNAILLSSLENRIVNLPLDAEAYHQHLEALKKNSSLPSDVVSREGWATNYDFGAGQGGWAQ